MKNLIKSVVLAAFIVFVAPVLAGTAHAWSILEAHNQANTTLVEVGNWCSGTVIDKDKGYVSTAAHCLKGVAIRHQAKAYRPDGAFFFYNWLTYSNFTVTQRTIDVFGNELGYVVREVRVLGVDELTDVAVLENTTSVPFTNDVRMSRTPVRYGDTVYSVGNPRMMPGVITKGYVVQPKIPLKDFYGVVTIMSTSDMDGGNSGGGLFDDRGEMVGLTNWYSPSGYENYATPVENVLRLLAKINPDRSPKSDKLAGL